jgi:ATP-dependent DNA ligase
MNEFSGTVSIDNIISQINEAEKRAAQLKQLLRNEKSVAVQDINRQIENKKAVIAKFNTELETLKAKLKQLNDLTPEEGKEPEADVKTEAVNKEAGKRKDAHSALYDVIRSLREASKQPTDKKEKHPVWPETDYTVYKLEDLIPGGFSESLAAKFKAATKSTK